MAERVVKSHPVVDLFDKRGITRDEVGKIYTTWAKDYDKDVTELTYYCPGNNAAQLEKLLGGKKDALILDVCCGTGLVGRELSKRGFHNLHALDASKEMLEQAKQKGVYKKVIQAFIGPERLDIADDKYDAVIMSGAIGSSHVDGGGLAELIRIVKPGGYVVMDSILKYTHDGDYDGKSFDEIIDSHIKAGRWVTLTRRLMERVFNNLDGMQYAFQVK